MGLVSTGLGFTENSGVLSQSFCLSENAQHLKFRWNFLSEEFFEWCDSLYDDFLRISLAPQSGPAETVFEVSVNQICVGNPVGASPTSLFFDQSGPGCGAFCRLDRLHRGHRLQSEQVDISACHVNGGKGVTLIIEAGTWRQCLRHRSTGGQDRSRNWRRRLWCHASRAASRHGTNGRLLSRLAWMSALVLALPRCGFNGGEVSEVSGDGVPIGAVGGRPRRVWSGNLLQRIE
jgi:hypothetical protein